jgi:hypothetical protein
MNLNEQFDELARQKLEERAFPFDEAAWHTAQQSLTNERRRRKGAWYLLALIPLAFITWMLWPASDNASIVADSSATHVESVEANLPSAPTAVSRTEARDALGAEWPAKTTAPTDASAGAETRPTASNAVIAPAAPPLAKSHDPAPAPPPSFAPRTPIGRTGPEDHAHVLESATSQRDAEPVARAEAPRAEEPAPSPLSPAPDVLPEDADTAPTRVSDNDPHLPPNDPTVIDAPTSVPFAIADNQAQEAQQESLAVPDTSAEEVVAATSEEPILAPNAPSDSVLAAEPLVLPPPLITARSPWEVSVLLGAQNSTSRYASDRFDRLSVEPGQSLAFGAEVMHMGRNVGLGFGVHHAAYNDRLTTPEQRTFAWEVTRSWFLQSVDTSILIITGTDTINGQVVHTGFNVNTTVQVLASSYDTATTERVRAARDFDVRLSFVELPVLLDAHIVQGRWSFGVRGGPSIGLLTARSGSLPTENDETDAYLRDATVRQWSVGWSARVYARYRFNSAWSVGLEPMARGQLIDAINGPVITRRSNAYGALLSLSYQLR